MNSPFKNPRASNYLVKLEEAARQLAISRRTLQSLIAQREIPVVRVSRRRVAIHPDDLAAYVERQRQ